MVGHAIQTADGLVLIDPPVVPGLPRLFNTFVALVAHRAQALVSGAVYVDERVLVRHATTMLLAGHGVPLIPQDAMATADRAP